MLLQHHKGNIKVWHAETQINGNINIYLAKPKSGAPQSLLLLLQVLQVEPAKIIDISELIFQKVATEY